MRLFNILVVDDEPHVVGTVTALLQCQSVWNLEVYHAYSGNEATQILDRNRIDIIITDIRMPGMDGLELTRHARIMWPECRAMLLTAYGDFACAYEAIQLGVAAYLLKTETDDRLLETVGRIIQSLERERLENAVIPEDAFQRNELNAHLLQNLILIKHDVSQLEQLSRMIGVPHKPELWLMCAIFAKRTSSERFSVLEWLVTDKIAHRAQMVASCQIEETILFLMAPNASISSVVGALELAQECYNDAYQEDVSFVLEAYKPAERRLSDLYHDICRFMEYDDTRTSSYIHVLAENATHTMQNSFAVVHSIKEYIHNHLQEDLSLNTLSCQAGYNPSYLSRLFREVTGEQISSYIAQTKIRRLREMIVDQRLTLGEIAENLGFNSRSYFNRFIKRLTGCTPQQFRDKVIDDY